MLEHRLPVPDDFKQKRTWAELVCPDCSQMFRVPIDQDGEDVICPDCQFFLNISGSEKDTLPTANEAPSTSSSTGQRRVRRKKQKSQASPDWERKSTVARSNSGNPLLWIVGGALLGLIVVGVGAWVMLGSKDEKKSSDDIVILSPVRPVAPILLPEDQMTAEEKRRQKQILDTVKTRNSFLGDGAEVVKKFLNAKTPAELESLVRTPAVTVPRMRAWYATHEWKPPGVKDVAYRGDVRVQGVIGMMVVRLNDFSVKPVVLENTPGGYLVDWESWVAWSSMDWEDLFEKRPTEPVEVRVHCSLDNYYNREFNDDSKWVSVRLAHPTSERTIYGYIAKDSPSMMVLLADIRNMERLATIIKVHYPENSVANNQVVISEYLLKGWVRPSAAEGESAIKKKVSIPTP